MTNRWILVVSTLISMPSLSQHGKWHDFYVDLCIPDQSVSFSGQLAMRVLLVGGTGGNRISAQPTHTRDTFFVVRNENEGVVQPARYTQKSPPIPPEAPDGSNLLRLWSGQIYGQEVHIPAQQLVSAPGKYTVTLVYKPQVPAELDRISGAITRADGVFESEPIELVVTP